MPVCCVVLHAGRGFDEALFYFHHENDYWTNQFPMPPRCTRSGKFDAYKTSVHHGVSTIDGDEPFISPQDLWYSGVHNGQPYDGERAFHAARACARTFRRES